MEADIYPGQCVTGSAKSAMMNVLAGINPQCTPPPPSSSAVPLPAAARALFPSPLGAPLAYPLCAIFLTLPLPPLTARSHTLSRNASPSCAISTSPSSSFALLHFFPPPFRYSRRIFTLLQLCERALRYYYLTRFLIKLPRIELLRVCPSFFSITSRQLDNCSFSYFRFTTTIM